MGSNQSIMHSVPPTGLFLILIVQACTAGELSLPSLPEAVQLLQLETIRGLELTILGKEDENRRLEETILAKEDENQRLEEIIESVKIEKEAVTRQNIMMEEEMVQIISERESLIEELESRLQFLERDGTIGELEARIQGLEMEKSEIEKEIVMVKEENGQIMGAMESEKIQLREEFVKKQMERDARCQDEKREIQDLKNKELDEISERLDQGEMAVAYMSTIMIHSNQMAEEQQNLLKVQAGTIQEFNEEVKVGRNCSTLLGAAADRISVQEEAINLLRASLVSSRNFSELSTSGMDQLNVAPFMMELLESYNQQAEMIENMKTALEKNGHVEAQTSELLTQLADLRSAVQSASINMETLEQQAHMIETQGRSIALLTPLLHFSNSSDILWFDNNSRSSRNTTEEVDFADVEVTMCSCLPRSASTNQLKPVRVDYQCQGDTNRSFQLPCPGGVCSSMELPSCADSLEWEEEEVSFDKCQELTFKGALVLCGVNGTKETTKRLDIGGGLVEEVVATPCNDCGDLEWTAWAPCANASSGRTIEGMLCRRRGNTYMGYEEEEKEFICEAPWTQLSTGCSRFHESPMTQSEARKFCEEEQLIPSHLVEIESAEENNAIIAEIRRRNFLSRKIEFWLGITDRHSEGRWVLESTGKSVVFTDWNAGEPNNGASGENCAHINNRVYKWNDIKCNSRTEWSLMLTALCEQ